MRLTEANLWKWLRPAIPLASRLETGATAVGVPDVTYSANGHHGFLELKIARRVRTGGYRVRFRPHQVEWLVTRDDMGGNVWIVCAVVPSELVWFIRGRYAPLVSKGCSEWEMNQIGRCLGPGRQLRPESVQALL